MQFGEGACQRQSKTRSMMLAAENRLHLAKGLQHRFQILLGDADPCVCDADEEISTGSEPRAQRDAAATRRKFHRIGKEVDEDLYDLAPIDPDVEFGHWQ